MIGCTRITHAGLEHLKGFTIIKTLDLTGAQITDEGIKKPEQALPNCEIRRRRALGR